MLLEQKRGGLSHKYMYMWLKLENSILLNVKITCIEFLIIIFIQFMI